MQSLQFTCFLIITEIIQPAKDNFSKLANYTETAIFLGSKDLKFLCHWRLELHNYDQYIIDVLKTVLK